MSVLFPLKHIFFNGDTLQSGHLSTSVGHLSKCKPGSQSQSHYSIHHSDSKLFTSYFEGLMFHVAFGIQVKYFLDDITCHNLSRATFLVLPTSLLPTCILAPPPNFMFQVPSTPEHHHTFILITMLSPQVPFIHILHNHWFKHRLVTTVGWMPRVSETSLSNRVCREPHG